MASSTTSSSKCIFQTALLLCFLIMMTEGYKCYHCAAADHSCRKPKKDQLVDCDCKLKVSIPGNKEPMWASEGCEKDDEMLNWSGCRNHWATKTVQGKYSAAGCTLASNKKKMCESTDDPGSVTGRCYCDIEGCNDRAGQKLTPKSSTLFLAIVVPLIINEILQKIIFN